ncbi:MAG TPA: hypothetical protein PK339_11430 [Flavitalea sp.]|nr:hypothetical protein [Flavitalea sp.]
MGKPLIIFSALLLTCSSGLTQTGAYKQPATLGIHFVFNDFETASAIRSSSLSAVLKENRIASIKDMSQGLALSYGKGISDHFDFYSTLIGSFLAYPMENREPVSKDFLLLEADVSVRGKLLTNKHWLLPYLEVGLGASKYQGYWGAFIPAGLGIQISFFGEAYLMIHSQYRMAVTETSNYHFVHSIGLVGNIGSFE